MSAKKAVHTSRPTSFAKLSNPTKARLCFLLTSLDDFHAGHLTVLFVARTHRPGHARFRFLYTAMAVYLDAYYGKNSQVLPVLRAIGLPLHAAALEYALTRPVGNADVRAYIRTYRNKMAAHPQFTIDGVKAAFPPDEIEAAGNDGFNQVIALTLEIRKILRRAYPSLVRTLRTLEREARAKPKKK